MDRTEWWSAVSLSSSLSPDGHGEGGGGGGGGGRGGAGLESSSSASPAPFLGWLVSADLTGGGEEVTSARMATRFCFSCV